MVKRVAYGLIYFLVGSLFLSACKKATHLAYLQPRISSSVLAWMPLVKVDEGSMELFTKREVDGAFVLFDRKRKTWTFVNLAKTSQRYIPASTFKIPNTLIGLDTGVISDEHFSLKWDGKKRPFEPWNRDQDLVSAMKNSVVWFYQEVARRIGEKEMQSHVNAFDYGNRDISGGIDLFWLRGGLRISPLEQVLFLRKWYAEKPPIRTEHVQLLKKLILLEESPGSILRGKTGLGFQDGKIVGWLVGTVEKGEDCYFYATLVLGDEKDMDLIFPMRMALTKELLQRYGVLESLQ